MFQLKTAKDYTDTQTQLLNELVNVLNMPPNTPYVFPAYIGLPPYHDTKNDLLYQILIKMVDNAGTGGGGTASPLNSYQYFQKYYKESFSPEVIPVAGLSAMFLNELNTPPAAAPGSVIGFDWGNIYGTKIRITVHSMVDNALDSEGGFVRIGNIDFTWKWLLQLEGVIKKGNDDFYYFNYDMLRHCVLINDVNGITGTSVNTQWEQIKKADSFYFSNNIGSADPEDYGFDFVNWNEYIKNILRQIYGIGTGNIYSQIGVEVQPFIAPIPAI